MNAHNSRRGFWLAMLAGVLIGILTAIQARINGELGTRVGNGLVAALVSFASGLLVVTIVTVSLKSGRAGAKRLGAGVRNGALKPWMLLGGVAGAFSVATQGVTVGIIGVSLLTVGIVAGQAVCGLLIDRIGYGPAGRVAVTLGRAAGAALALCAVAVTLTGDLLANTPWFMLFMPFGVGIGIAYQQATNGRLGAAVGNPMTATLVNFIGGTIILAIAAGIAVLVQGSTKAFPTEWWLYLGGAMGVTYIFISAAVVHRIGVLLLGLASVVGQLTTSVLVDQVWPPASPPPVWQQLAMVILAMLAAIVAALPWHRLRRRVPR